MPQYSAEGVICDVPQYSAGDFSFLKGSFSIMFKRATDERLLSRSVSIESAFFAIQDLSYVAL